MGASPTPRPDTEEACRSSAPHPRAARAKAKPVAVAGAAIDVGGGMLRCKEDLPYGGVASGARSVEQCSATSKSLALYLT